MAKVRKTPKSDEAELQELVFPLTPGNGEPMKLGELLALVKTMNDESLPLAERTSATAQLLPHYHMLVPEKAVPWPTNRMSS